jgi:hypothetical protein
VTGHRSASVPVLADILYIPQEDIERKPGRERRSSSATVSFPSDEFAFCCARRRRSPFSFILLQQCRPIRSTRSSRTMQRTKSTSPVRGPPFPPLLYFSPRSDRLVFAFPAGRLQRRPCLFLHHLRCRPFLLPRSRRRNLARHRCW